jgi:GGDEF domain-containing protein
MIWRKAMFISFALIFVAILFWAIPWLPYGLSVEDYDDRVTLLMVLIILASLTAFGTVYHRDLGRRIEQNIVTWSTVHEGLGDLRQREYFYDRIILECDRASIDHSEFTVVALRLNDDAGGPVGLEASERILRVLAPMAEESDCLAALGPHEIGILAPKTDGAHAAALAERLRSLVALSTDSPLQVRVGWSVYPADGGEAGGLVGLARQRLLASTPASAQKPPEPKSDIQTVA